MSEARAVTNFAGNAIATVIIGHWTGGLDRKRLDTVLRGEDPFDEATMLDDHGHGEPVSSVDDTKVEAALPGHVEQPNALTKV
jgi:aerobic C4-dicarboxylate transport protein